MPAGTEIRSEKILMKDVFEKWFRIAEYQVCLIEIILIVLVPPGFNKTVVITGSVSADSSATSRQNEQQHHNYEYVFVTHNRPLPYKNHFASN